MKVRDTLTIKESKTQKDNILVVNKTVHKALKEYLENVKGQDKDSYIFSHQEGQWAFAESGCQ